MKNIYLILAFLLILPEKAAALNDRGNILKPIRTDTAPVIDGKLDDPLWQKAPFVTGFKSFMPDFGRSLPGKTIAYYAYDKENIYFAFKCYDSEPDKIKATVTNRDNIYNDDFICINLDSFNDQQALYALYVNPLGIQGDSRYANNVEDRSVDFVWYSAGKLDSDGYFVELRIPFKSIRYKSGNPVTMSIFFERKFSSTSQHGSFPELDPKMGYAFLIQMQPIEFRNIKHYTLLEVLPAATISERYSRQDGSMKSEGRTDEFSLSAKYGITSRLILDGTYNPDFSQVEADAGQVDLNLRYALYYPEKRPFFLEGNENFNFGGAIGANPLASVVHTRNIVNPELGVKLSGKLGRSHTIAVIDALDELPEDQHEQFGDRAHFTIARYKRTLKDDSYIGGFYTGREVKNAHNRVAGIDGFNRLTKSSYLEYNAFLAWTKDAFSDDDRDGHAVALNYVYDSRDWGIGAGFVDIGKNFETQTGYLTRNGISIVRAVVTKKFYPAHSSIRRISPQIVTVQRRDNIYEMYETDNTLQLSIVMVKSTYLTGYLNYSDEIFLGKRFDTNTGGFNVSSQPHKMLRLSCSARISKSIKYSGNPYQGYGKNSSVSITFLPTANLQVNSLIVYSDFYRDSDSVKEYDYTIFREKVTFQLNKYLFFRGIVENNNYRKRVLTDFLSSFTYIPGTVIHLGYGELYEKQNTVSGGITGPGSRPEYEKKGKGFFFKASYLWRM